MHNMHSTHYETDYDFSLEEEKFDLAIEDYFKYQQLQKKIDKIGCITREDLVPFEKYLPANTSLESFNELPSKENVNLIVSMEAGAGIIAAIIAAIIGAILACVALFSGGGGGGGGAKAGEPEKKNKELKQNLAAAKPVIRENQYKGSHTPTPPPVKNPQNETGGITKLAELYKRDINKFKADGREAELIVTILGGNSKYHELFGDNGAFFFFFIFICKYLNVELLNKTVELLQMFNSDTGRTNLRKIWIYFSLKVESDFLFRLNNVLVNHDEYKALFTDYTFETSKERTEISNQVSHFIKKVKEFKGHPAEKIIPFERFIWRVENDSWGVYQELKPNSQIDHYLKNKPAITSTIEHISDQIKKLNSDQDAYSVNEDDRRSYIDILVQVKGIIVAYKHYYDFIEEIISMHEKTTERASKFFQIVSS